MAPFPIQSQHAHSSTIVVVVVVSGPVRVNPMHFNWICLMHAYGKSPIAIVSPPPTLHFPHVKSSSVCLHVESGRGGEARLCIHAPPVRVVVNAGALCCCSALKLPRLRCPRSLQRCLPSGAAEPHGPGDHHHHPPPQQPPPKEGILTIHVQFALYGSGRGASSPPPPVNLGGRCFSCSTQVEI